MAKRLRRPKRSVGVGATEEHTTPKTPPSAEAISPPDNTDTTQRGRPSTVCIGENVPNLPNQSDSSTR
jgi:hypothetical protein